MNEAEMERKLLEILDSGAEGEDSAEVSETEVAEAFPYLDEDMRNKLARLLVKEMKTPEQIERAERVAEHNAEVEKKRRERLAWKRERQGHKKKKR